MRRRSLRPPARRRGRAARLSPVQAFETEGLIGAGAAPAVLTYLFHRIEGRLDGRPTLLIIDEGWLVLDDPAFAQQLREWLKTLRKKNASVVFATQSLSDIDGSTIAPAIIESCPTRIFLPNERAIEPQITAIYRRFGLNDRQIEILARATPKRDYYCQSRRGNRLFELGLGPSRSPSAPPRPRPTTPRSNACSPSTAATPSRRPGSRTTSCGWAADLIPDLDQPGDVIMIKLRHLAAASAVVLTLAVAAPPASAQWIVYDPDQLQPERADRRARAAADHQPDHVLNNQAHEPGQSGAQPRQPADVDAAPSSSRRSPQTQSLLSQAQNIAFNVQRVQTAYSTSYGDRGRHRLDHALVANAQTRWQNSVAAFEDSLKIQAGVVGNIPTQPQRHDLAGHRQPERHRRASGGAGRQPAPGAAIPAALRPGRGAVAPRAGPMRWSRRAAPPPRRRASRTTRPSRRAAGYQPGNVTMFSGN